LIYAVYRYTRDAALRQNTIEQELRSVRELQQVLIPEALPSLTGFAVTSIYRPAREVGGDFFQILPLDGEHAGSTLILIGDVSGKGLKAAMTVSLIVGTIRTLAETISSPAEMLVGLNRRLEGRLQGGFATCIALRMEASGNCLLASAGHPAPYLNGKEVVLPGALPLGLNATASYEETSLRLNVGDHFVLYTDGLLEARKASGEIFSFERLATLLADSPDAAKAAEAAINFGQDDDITVLTLTRLAVGEESSTRLTAPILSASPA
jgi:serine phosphatase RsbU (regulator of sigma subunit)